MGEKPVVIVDTREQESYSFDPDRFDTIRRALPAGDYSLAGFETDVAVERKTLEDFVHTVIRERDRFRSELLKLSGYSLACVVVEANIEDVVTGGYASGAHPSSVLGAAMSIIVDYGVPVYFCSNRQVARRFTSELLLRYLRRTERACKSPQQQNIPASAERSSESSTPLPGSPPGFS